MTDHDALLRAICEFPDEDTPRLIFADFLEENGEAERAAFVRAQVEAARLPDWEPFAVFCRHRRPEWFDGGPFRHTLPEVPEAWGVAWPTDEPPFCRGLGWRVHVRSSLLVWHKLAPRLFDQAPVGELYLNPVATLDDWRGFAAADWVRRLRVLHLDGARLNEPVRALCESAVPVAITDVHFGRASSPGIGFTVSDLLKSRLAGPLRGLHFRVGDQSVEDLIDALTHDGALFERLTLAVMGMTAELIRRLCDRGGLLGLGSLDLRDNRLDVEGVTALAQGLAGSNLSVLGLAGTHPGAYGLETLSWREQLRSVRRLDLSRNPLSPRATKVLSGSHALAGLRALNLARCRIDDKGVRHLTRAKFWTNLVELDLRENPIDWQSVRHLLLAPAQPDLTALLLDGTGLGAESRAALRERFGDAVIFAG
jgi:uncharacterized protein (TIGR02996 family)